MPPLSEVCMSISNLRALASHWERLFYVKMSRKLLNFNECNIEWIFHNCSAYTCKYIHTYVCKHVCNDIEMSYAFICFGEIVSAIKWQKKKKTDLLGNLNKFGKDVSVSDYDWLSTSCSMPKAYDSSCVPQPTAKWWLITQRATKWKLLHKINCLANLSNIWKINTNICVFLRLSTS